MKSIAESAEVSPQQKLEQILNQLNGSLEQRHSEKEKPESEKVKAQNKAIKEFKQTIMQETRQIVVREQEITEHKNVIKQSNEQLMAAKLEMKLIQKMTSELKGSKFDDLLQKNEKLIASLEKQIIEKRERISVLNQEIQEIKKKLVKIFKENKQKIMMITVLARMKHKSFLKTLDQLYSEMKPSMAKSLHEEDLKAKNLYQNFRDLQHVYHTLQSKVLNTIEIPKNTQVQKPRKKQKEEQAVNWENITKGIESQAQQLNQAIKEKTETINQMSKMISQISQMNQVFEQNINESKQIRGDMNLKRDQIEQLENQIEE